MQNITENLKSLAGKGMDAVKDTASQAGDYLQANPTLAAMLLAGGGSGLLGGYLTSQQAEEEGEDKTQRRNRILRNALMAGAAGAGAVGLGATGLKRLSEAAPSGSMNPIQQKLTSPLMRLLGGAGGAAIGLSKGTKADEADILSQARKSITKPEHIVKMRKGHPDFIKNLAEKEYNFSPEADDLTKAISDLKNGIPISPKLQALLEKMLGKDKAHAAISGVQLGVKNNAPQISSVLKALLGTSRAGRYARLGGLGGVFLPEIVGTTKDVSKTLWDSF